VKGYKIAVNGLRIRASLLGLHSWNATRRTWSKAKVHSIAEDNRSLEANVQKADALVDLVRTALNGILTQDEQVDNIAHGKGGTLTEVVQGGDDHKNIVPDVFQAAYDFFSGNNQEPAALKEMEEGQEGDELKCTGFNPNPRVVIPIEKEISSEHLPVATKEVHEFESSVVEDPVLSSIIEGNESSSSSVSSSKPVDEGINESSLDTTTSNSDNAVLDEASSKESAGNKNNNTDQRDRFNVDGIPLELRSKKIWKAFDSAT
jgi:hypothetical protein